MTVSEMIQQLQKIPDKDKCCVLSFDGDGWSNIEEIREGWCVVIFAEQTPVFAEN